MPKPDFLKIASMKIVKAFYFSLIAAISLLIAASWVVADSVVSYRCIGSSRLEGLRVDVRNFSVGGPNRPGKADFAMNYFKILADGSVDSSFSYRYIFARHDEMIFGLPTSSYSYLTEEKSDLGINVKNQSLFANENFAIFPFDRHRASIVVGAELVKKGSNARLEIFRPQLICFDGPGFSSFNVAIHTKSEGVDDRGVEIVLTRPLWFKLFVCLCVLLPWFPLVADFPIDRSAEALELIAIVTATGGIRMFLTEGDNQPLSRALLDILLFSPLLVFALRTLWKSIVSKAGDPNSPI